jgi:hypothetical protein
LHPLEKKGKQKMASRNELVIRGNAVGLTASNYPNDSKFEQKILYLEKNGTTYAGALGTGVFTIAGADVAAADTIVVGNRTYTFRSTLTGVKATAVLTGSDVFTADETVQIGSITYTFKGTLDTNPVQPFQVLIGASLAASLDNLKLAINAGTNAGEYSVGTYAHPQVTATTNSNTEQTVEARDFGTSFNKLPVSEQCANSSWGAATLANGTATVADEIKIGASAAATLDNIKSAINNTGTEGTDYSWGTKAHNQVTATTNTNTAQTVEARNSAFDNASIAISVTGGGNIAAGAATLASGVRGVIAANTTTTGGSAGISGDKNLI